MQSSVSFNPVALDLLRRETKKISFFKTRRDKLYSNFGRLIHRLEFWLTKKNNRFYGTKFIRFVIAVFGQKGFLYLLHVLLKVLVPAMILDQLCSYLV